MEKPLISVIVPIYKVEQFLKECLESIVNQTYKNLEIILVDDGSPDNCPRICDEYANKDKRIIVIHKENGGLSSARNAGLDICKGEYISFIDSDDIVSISFIESLYDLLVNNDANISQCDFINFRDSSDIRNYISDNEIVTVLNGIEMQKEIFEKDGYKNIVVWNKLYKKRIYNELRFPFGKINEDEFCSYRAFDLSNKVAISNKKLYYYRTNENSIMGRRFNPKRFDILEAYDEKLQYYSEKKYIELYNKTLISYFNLLKRFYVLTIKYIDEPKDEYKNLIKKKLKENYLKIKSQSDISRKYKIKCLIYCHFIDLYYLKKHNKL